MRSADFIPYQATPDRSHLSVDRDDYHVRVTVPPLPSWRMLPRGLLWGLAVLGVAVLAFLTTFAVMLVQRRPGSELAGPVSNLALYGLGLTATGLVAYARLHRWTTFTVTADRFLLNLRTASREGRTASWPRAQVLQVKAVPATGRVLIRVRGRAALEVFVSPRAAVVERVARELDDALTLTFAPGPSAPVAATPLGPIAVPSRARRLAEMTVAGVGGVLVVAGLFVPPLLWLLVVAAIPLGIWFGTQEKEFYM